MKLFFFTILFFSTLFLNVLLQPYIVAWKNEQWWYVPASLFLSYKNIAADYYWLKLLSDSTTRHFYTDIDYITSLDESFDIVYRYGFIVLYTYKNRKDLAFRILKKYKKNGVQKRTFFYMNEARCP
ncbi:MAG: hypothetical protein AB7R69_02225 [Candidatus Babeliales bacterium]